MATATTETAPNATQDYAPMRGGIVPSLTLPDAAEAAEFYKRAFGAIEADRRHNDAGTRIIFCHLQINGSSLVISDGAPEQGMPAVPMQGFNLMLPVTEIDAFWKRAVDAGAEVQMPLQLMFWGDRFGLVKDPFGVTWSMVGPAA